jgi:hypothetical protein
MIHLPKLKPLDNRVEVMVIPKVSRTSLRANDEQISNESRETAYLSYYNQIKESKPHRRNYMSKG